MATTELPGIFRLPSEILVSVLWHLTTPSFIQAILTCHRVFDLAAASREIILYHLHQIPGIKLGLEDHTISTKALFLILRQRAAAHLYGANFHSDCKDLRFPNGTLNATASCLAESADYINISLAMKESLVVRHYDNRGDLKDHTGPFIHGLGQVIQVVHWTTTVTVLYRQQSQRSSPVTCCAAPSPFHPGLFRTCDNDHDQDADKFPDDCDYYLLHYSAYTNDPPEYFQIPPLARTLPATSKKLSSPLVPVHLAVQNRLKCAILWDVPTRSDSWHSSRDSGDASRDVSQVVLYGSDRRAGPLAESTYTSSLLYPVQPRSKSEGYTSLFIKKTEYLSRHRPVAIAFTDGGSNLKLYRAGSITPYSILAAPNATGRRPFPTNGHTRIINEEYIRLEPFRLDAPFYGQHVFDQTPHEEDHPHIPECTKVYLHLGSAAPEQGRKRAIDEGSADLFIIQDRIMTDAEECDHFLDLDDIGRLPYDDLRVVARLWGLNSSLLMNSTMTALDSVCISPKGTRIAIACWDRILVWALNPNVFCEEWVPFVRRRYSSSVSDGTGSLNAGVVAQAYNDPGTVVINDDSDTASTVNSDVTNAPPPRNEAMVKATKYYDLVNHESFGEIVELKPIVLKLPGGAIARRMMWSSDNKGSSDDVDIDNVFDYEDPEASGRLPDSVSVTSVDGVPPYDYRRRARRPDDAEQDNFTYYPLPNDYYTGPTLESDNRQQIESIGAGLEELVEEEMGSQQPTLSTILEPDVDELPAVSVCQGGVNLGEFLDGSDGHSVAAPLGQFADNTIHQDEELAPKPREVKVRPLSPSNLAAHITADDVFLPASDNLPQAPQSEDSDKAEDQPVDSPPPAPLFHNPRRPWSPARARPPSPSPSRSASTRSYDGVEDLELRGLSRDSRYRPRPIRRRNRPRQKDKRDSEDELIVMTDRGVQLWNLGVWAAGKRERGWLDEKLD